MEYIRRIEPKDKEQVNAISNTIWGGDDYIPFVVDEWIADTEGYFAGLFADDDTLIGFGRLVSQGDGNFWLEGLRKDQSLKIKGVGKRIADYLINIALEKECKSLKFSTDVENLESISLHEKMGFCKIKQWSFLEVQQNIFKDKSPNDLEENVQEVHFQQFYSFIKNSNFLAEMGNYLCEGWKVYDVSNEYLKALHAKSISFGIIHEGVMQAMISTIIDNEHNVFIVFLEYKTKEQCQALIQKAFTRAVNNHSPAVQIIVPNQIHIECLKNYGLNAWNQNDEFLLYEYRGK